MNNVKIRFASTLLFSVIIYYLICILITIAIKSRFIFGDSELFITGSISLILISLLWFLLNSKYPIFNKNIGIFVLMISGILISILLSILYIYLRTDAIVEEPGEFGEIALLLMIFISLSSQIVGFIIGFIPIAVFILKLNKERTLKENQIQ